MITCYVTRSWPGVKNGDIVQLHPIKARRLAAMGMVITEEDVPAPKPEPKKEIVAVVAKRKGRPPRVRP